MDSPFNSLDFAKALADETRQKIMSLCCCTEVCVNEIVESLDVSQPTISHHLKILTDAGLVHRVRHGKQVFYSLNQKRLAEGCCQVSNIYAPTMPVTITNKS